MNDTISVIEPVEMKRYWMLDAGYWILDTISVIEPVEMKRYWMLDAGSQSSISLNTI